VGEIVREVIGLSVAEVVGDTVGGGTRPGKAVLYSLNMRHTSSVPSNWTSKALQQASPGKASP